jgi:hypothetical protein
VTVQGVPTVAECRAWGNIGAGITDADLQALLDAELRIQTDTCVLDVDDDGVTLVLPQPLSRALIRRVQREVAVRNIPLAWASDVAAEYGPLMVPAWDAEVSRLESSYRLHVIA